MIWISHDYFLWFFCPFFWYLFVIYQKWNGKYYFGNDDDDDDDDDAHPVLTFSIAHQTTAKPGWEEQGEAPVLPLQCQGTGPASRPLPTARPPSRHPGHR